MALKATTVMKRKLLLLWIAHPILLSNAWAAGTPVAAAECVLTAVTIDINDPRLIRATTEFDPETPKRRRSPEESDWRKARQQNTSEAYRLFLHKHGENGTYAKKAKELLESAKRHEAPREEAQAKTEEPRQDPAPDSKAAPAAGPASAPTRDENVAAPGSSGLEAVIRPSPSSPSTDSSPRGALATTEQTSSAQQPADRLREQREAYQRAESERERASIRAPGSSPLIIVFLILSLGLVAAVAIGVRLHRQGRLPLLARSIGKVLHLFGGLSLLVTVVHLWKVGFPRLEGPWGQTLADVAGVLAPYACMALVSGGLFLAGRRLMRPRGTVQTDASPSSREEIPVRPRVIAGPVKIHLLPAVALKLSSRQLASDWDGGSFKDGSISLVDQAIILQGPAELSLLGRFLSGGVLGVLLVRPLFERNQVVSISLSSIESLRLEPWGSSAYYRLTRYLDRQTQEVHGFRVADADAPGFAALLEKIRESLGAPASRTAGPTIDTTALKTEGPPAPRADDAEIRDRHGNVVPKWLLITLGVLMLIWLISTSMCH
jgi:hypothetical protein